MAKTPASVLNTHNDTGSVVGTVSDRLTTDGSGNLNVSIASGGGTGGTASSFGATFPATGTAAGASDGTLMQPLLVDASGFLKVNVAAGSGSGVSVTDAATATAGSSVFVPAGGVYNDSFTNLASGKQGLARLTAARAFHHNLRDNSGNEVGILAAPLRTDPVGTTTQPVSASSLPLPTGAATSSAQGTGNTSLASIDGKITVVNTGAVVVSSSALPSGAATAAKQPALGTAGSASADVITIQGIASMTKILVTPDSVALPANQSVNVSQINGVTPLMGAGNTGTGSHRVTIATDQVAIPVSQSGTWTVQPGNTPNSTPWLVTQTPATSGGLSISRTLSANNTTGISVKGSAGQIFGWVITNVASSARFVKIYNTSAPTVGTTVPVITLAIPGNANGTGMVAAFDSGIAFGTSIGIGITTGVADNDTGAPAANDVVVNIFYK